MYHWAQIFWSYSNWFITNLGHYFFSGITQLDLDCMMRMTTAVRLPVLRYNMWPEVGIYKRKQELDQESDQEKKKVFFFFFVAFLVEFLFSCFLDCFLGRVLVLFFLIAFLVELLFSFINSHPRMEEPRRKVIGGTNLGCHNMQCARTLTRQFLFGLAITLFYFKHQTMIWGRKTVNLDDFYFPWNSRL